MLIPLLVVLGVDLVVIIAVVVAVMGRKRWVRRRPGAFAAAIRSVDGEVDGLGPTWRRGYGRWVRDVLVWTKAPFLFRTEVLPVDSSGGSRPARPGEVRRLGDEPLVVTFAVAGGRIDVAVRAEDRSRALAPFHDDVPTARDVPAPRPPTPLRRSREA